MPQDKLPAIHVKVYQLPALTNKSSSFVNFLLDYSSVDNFLFDYLLIKKEVDKI
jgi:hypothetical protein